MSANMIMGILNQQRSHSQHISIVFVILPYPMKSINNIFLTHFISWNNINVRKQEIVLSVLMFPLETELNLPNLRPCKRFIHLCLRFFHFSFTCLRILMDLNEFFRISSCKLERFLPWHECRVVKH